jgi:HAD superfamily hydrolase (TIGR01509 family)
VTVPEFPVYIFDVDGTLVDSAADICGAIQGVLASTRRPNVEFNFLTTYIGKHLIDLFRDLEFSPEETDTLIAEYRRIYPERKHANTRVYPGVKEALAALPGRKTTATTKGTPTTRSVLEMFELLPYFDHIQGTDGFPAKPEPDVIHTALKALRGRPEDCLFVGDSATDMEAGRRAGVRVCGVTYGYGVRSEMEKWSPDFWIDDLRELIRTQKTRTLTC